MLLTIKQAQSIAAFAAEYEDRKYVALGAETKDDFGPIIATVPFGRQERIHMDGRREKWGASA